MNVSEIPEVCPRCSGVVVEEPTIEKEGRIIDVRCLSCGERFYRRGQVMLERTRTLKYSRREAG